MRYSVTIDMFVFLSIVGAFLILMSLYIKSADPKIKPKVSTIGCPGTGTGKLHRWVPNLTDGGSICTICNKVPGSFNDEN